MSQSRRSTPPRNGPPARSASLLSEARKLHRSTTTRTEANVTSKIADVDSCWHRMGDIGDLDPEGRFWYCGRKSHRVDTASNTLFTECVEGLFNAHLSVRRSAPAGVGPRGRQVPVMIVGLNPAPGSDGWKQDHRRSLIHIRKRTRSDTFSPIPVCPSTCGTCAHNLNREQLSVWAAQRLMRQPAPAASPAASRTSHARHWSPAVVDSWGYIIEVLFVARRSCASFGRGDIRAGCAGSRSRPWRYPR